jgi:glucokinase
MNLSEFRPAIAISLSPTALHGALVTPDGMLHSPVYQTLPAIESRLSVLRQTAEACRALMALEQLTPDDIAGIGVAVPAAINLQTGMIDSTDNQLPGWQGTEIAAILRETTGCFTIVEESIQLTALAEAHFGAGRDIQRLFYVHVDTTIRGAIIENGAIWRSTHSQSEAVGSLVADWKGLKPVTLNEVASTPGIVRSYHSRSRANSRPEFAEIRRLAVDDALARRVIRDGGRLLGTILAPIAAILDPQQVMIGGNALITDELWWQAFETAFYRYLPPQLDTLLLAQATLPVGDAALPGAAYRVWQSLML